MYDDENYLEEARSEAKPLPKRKSRTGDFNEAERIKLAILVRNTEHIWNVNHVLHSNSAAMNKAWNDISIQMGKSKEKCKLAFVALRESYRYYQKTAGANDDPLAYNRMNDWPLAKELSFLSNVKRATKKIYPHVEIFNEDSEQNTQAESSKRSYIVKEENRTSFEFDNYDKNQHETSSDFNISSASPSSLHNELETADYDMYKIQEKESVEEQSSNANRDNMGILVNQLSKLINAQTEFMKRFREKSTENLFYQTQLIACDALLKQLPKSVAEKTLVEIQNYILKKINDQQKLKNSFNSNSSNS